MRKIPVLRGLVEGKPLAALGPAVAPLPGELVVSKQYASVFFGTPLASLLSAGALDTAILIGCSTSACVRASAVAALSCGFHILVVRECAGDRHPAPQAANLFDIDARYGDVIGKAEVPAWLGGERTSG